MSGDYARLGSVAGPVSRETFEQLQAFESFFQKWNARINLSSPATAEDAWERHILDSAQLLKIAPQATEWVDLGSGGGFPGLVVAFLLADRQGACVHLVESNRKKASFLQAATGQFSLPARIHARRIEDCYELVPQAQIITARALAPLPLLLELAAPWLMAGAIGLFHKGRDYRSELKESAHRWSFDLVEHESMIDPEGAILELRNLWQVAVPGPKQD